MKHYSMFIIAFVIYGLGYAQITPHTMVGNMGRGINIGNVLSAPKEGNWALALTDTYLKDVASAGFTSVRIPIDFFGDRTSGNTSVYSKAENTSASYTGTPSDYVVNPAYLDRIEEVITWALNENLIVVLDFHGNTLKDEFLHTFSTKSKDAPYYTHPTSAKRAADNEKFRTIWLAIATRFKEYSDQLVFEIVNEPYFSLSATEMDILNTDIINIIRSTGGKNTYRNIIITGGGKNSFEAPLQISDQVLNMDNYLIATFHYYWPRDFTASASENHNDYDWGTPTDKTEIDKNFGAVQTWSADKNIPIYLGEFGADNEGGFNYNKNTYGAFGGPEEASRILYHEYLAEKAIDLGFSFSAWDAGHKSGKTIYIAPSRTWAKGIKEALLGNTLSNNESNKSEFIKVYPNPSRDHINIKSNQTIDNVELYNLHGSMIYKNNTKNITQLHWPPIANGTYILKAKLTNGAHYNTKILILN
ncbi:cellulase family glycosylhydrolase [Tamlana sp. s12]|uniref:cellulase family glycosylhydrolase n=1 Tax=Tamlana sp. s12 TaxID=1630406 RepID=UPI0009EE71CE|nr:cellulase family glycosylhydrolase [Tamlana sp. s12]QQY81693.1 cellulase family glycosylhydrolase [Tamlana sp. s12]